MEQIILSDRVGGVDDFLETTSPKSSLSASLQVSSSQTRRKLGTQYERAREKYKDLEKAYSDLKVTHDMLKGELTRMVARDAIVGPSPDIGHDWGFGPMSLCLGTSVIINMAT